MNKANFVGLYTSIVSGVLVMGLTEANLTMILPSLVILAEETSSPDLQSAAFMLICQLVSASMFIFIDSIQF